MKDKIESMENHGLYFIKNITKRGDIYHGQDYRWKKNS